MNILVIGASQGTGALTVQKALEHGHNVTAFARSPQKLTLEHPKLKKLAGDFHQQASIMAAVKNHDAVIVTASSTSLQGFKENPHYFSQGTGYVVEAMKQAGVKRLVILSALGVGESRKLMNFIVAKIVIDYILRAPFADHERQEKLVMASGLDWVIARPGRLSNGPATGHYEKQAELIKVASSIARHDVADFLLEAATSDTWLRKTVHLGQARAS